MSESLKEWASRPAARFGEYIIPLDGGFSVVIVENGGGDQGYSYTLEIWKHGLCFVSRTIKTLKGRKVVALQIEAWLRQAQERYVALGDATTQTVPILATRFGRLDLSREQPFKSVVWPNEFGVTAEARCKTAWEVHDAPHLACTCGFYAVPADKLMDHADCQYSSSFVVLLVELYGRVIEHEFGYRAQYQRVLEAQFPPCEICDGDIERFLFRRNVDGKVCTIEWADCGKHDHWFKEVIAISRDDLSRRLGVPVTTRR